MNKIFLIGNLTHDPELSETKSGVKVCNFTIAVNRPYKNSAGERKTDFFRCEAWRGLAELICKYVQKGNKVEVNGPVELDTYEDGNGTKKPTMTVKIEEIEFLSSKSVENEKEVNSKLHPLSNDEDIPF